MKRSRPIVLLSLCLALSLHATSFRAAVPDQRPIELDDIMSWKSITSTALSDDGAWFAYRIGPLEGDSDVVIRQTSGDKEYRFPVGEVPAPTGGPGPGPGDGGGQGGGAAVAVSADSKFAAFAIHPSQKEAAQLKKQRKPLQQKVGIVNLASGEKIEIPRVRRFAFSGENAGWIALHKYGPDAPGGAAGPAAGPAPSGGASGAAAAAGREDRPKGTDLLLRELATGQEINIGNVAEFGFDKPGRRLVWIIDAQDKAGNGITLRDMETGAIRSIESDQKAVYSRLAWTQDGDGLTALKGVEDRAYEDKLYGVVAFKDFGAGGPQKTVFNPADASGFPAEMTVSPNRTATWTKGLDALLFGIHETKKKEKPEGEKGDEKAEGAAPARPDDTPADEKVDLVIWHWKDKRLQSQQAVQENQDKNFSYLSVYRPAEKRFFRLADDEIRDVVPAPQQKFAIGRADEDYELMGNLDGRRYADVYAFDLATGKKALIVKKSRFSMGPSPKGTHFLYYDDGHYYVFDLTAGQAINVTKAIPTSFINAEDDHNVVKPPTPTAGWSQDGRFVLLSDNWDVWQVPVDGSAATNLTLDGRKEQIRYRGVVDLDADEPGHDLTRPVYISVFSEWTKKAGIGVIEPGRPGVKRLMWEDASFGAPQKARKADVFLYTRQTFREPPDYFVGDATLADGRRLTALGAGQEKFLWSAGTMLVDYVSAKGDRLQGALHLPANYEKGKSYPTIVNFYEKMSGTINQYTRPSANGFNRAVYTSNGYAVFNPDITYKINDPGMSAVWCVVPAVKAAIATGVVDPKRIGIHGHSWGGYQTAFLITQTDLFAAAVAGAPLTNMISMYSLIYKNTGGTNGAIFESSQGRFTSGPWDNWEAYTRNSPVVFARNVKTPLIILHNDKDGAVDFTQGVEYYNTLRRLQKPVVMLEYPGENHGLARRANQKDYTVRMKEFFDHYLRGKPMPAWYEEGVPRLDMNDHLKKRQPVKAAPVPTTTESGQKGPGGDR